ncbi:GNAT family N-acetyltransferase [Nonomuraea typhae]|uniref:GNAT family N-acetyltransferase n=1 Tax=Nonomuraea typhae TaxID=2603600 RepID=UPI0012FB071F|nr:GNAT family N-acetyltransferase [Nonomuraea typhae]
MEIVIADKASDMEEAGTVLGRAFAEDPVISWLLPGGVGRERMFAALGRYMHDVVEVAREGAAIVGVAIWDPPGFVPDLEAGGPELLAAMGDQVAKGMQLDETFGAHRPAEPHWYLAQIGTHPRGAGVGGTLLRSGLARTAGLPVYLEASAAGNVPIYERFGFRVTSEIRLPDGPSVWGMLRPAL